MDLEFATTEQLIAELMKRPTFVGIIIAVETDVTGDWPRKGDPVAVHASGKLRKIDQARVMATSIRRVLDTLQ